MQQLDMTWRVSLHQMKSMLAGHLPDRSRVTMPLTSSPHCWQGHELQAWIGVESGKRDGGGDEYLTCLGLYMKVINLPEGATCVAAVKQHMLNTRNGSYVNAGKMAFSGANHFAGGLVSRRQLVQLGSPSNAAEAEDRLRELGLVHSDGCLLVQSIVSRM
jgi:hypothetical protein